MIFLLLSLLDRFSAQFTENAFGGYDLIKDFQVRLLPKLMLKLVVFYIVCWIQEITPFLFTVQNNYYMWFKAQFNDHLFAILGNESVTKMSRETKGLIAPQVFLSFTRIVTRGCQSILHVMKQTCSRCRPLSSQVAGRW